MATTAPTRKQVPLYIGKAGPSVFAALGVELVGLPGRLGPLLLRRVADR